MNRLINVTIMIKAMIDNGDNDDDDDDVDIIMTMMTVMMSVMGFSPSSAGLEVCLGQNPRGARYSHHIFCYTLDV